MRHTATRAPRFDREWKEMLELLPEHRQSLMEQAIREYQLTGNVPENLDGTEMMAFLLIKKIVDRRAKQRRARLNKKTNNTPLAATYAAKDVVETEPKPKGKDSTPSLNSVSHTNRRRVKEKCRYTPKDKYNNRHRPNDERHRAIIKRLNRISAKQHK